MIAFSSLNIPTGVEVELAQVETTHRKIAIGEGRIRHQHFSLGLATALRVIDDDRHGFLTSTTSNEVDLNRFLRHAHELAQNSPKDSHQRFASPSDTYPVPPLADKDLFKKSFPELTKKLQDLEKRILATDRRIQKVIRLELMESSQKWQLENTRSLHVESDTGSTTCLAEVIAEDKGQIEVAWDMKNVRFSADLCLENFVDDLADQAVKSLGGHPLTSGDYPVLIHPRVGCQLLNLIGEALSAEAVQLGRSFLKDFLDRPVAASCVTLIDDPLLPTGVSSTHVDDEGTPTRFTTLVENGILKEFLFDVRTASRAQRASNGHGFKTNISSLPKPRPSNFYLKPGDKKEAELLSSYPQVFYIWDVMGLHMADPITGEFSLGASGFLYEKGQWKQPVRGVTVSGRLLEVLGNITQIGNNLKWFGDRAAPPFLVSHLSVSGT